MQYEPDEQLLYVLCIVNKKIYKITAFGKHIFSLLKI